MKPSCLRFVVTLISGAIALLAAACSLIHRAKSQDAESILPMLPHPVHRISQFGYGQAAEFALCDLPDCPIVTRKILAVPNSDNELASKLSHTSSHDTKEPLILSSSINARTALSIDTSVSQAANKTNLTVQFSFATSSLSSAAKIELDSVNLNTPEVDHVLITGRTDSTGSMAINHALAKARAYAVGDYLHTHRQYPIAKLKIASEGSCCYVATNSTSQGRGFNRRVEVIFQRTAKEL